MENKEAIVYFEQLERQFKALLRPDGAPTLWAEHVQVLIDAIRTAIDHLLAPTQEQVERMMGEWERNHIGNGWDDWDEIKCPKCGYYDRRPSFPIDGFCPACGAPMSQKAANIILKRSGTLNEPLTWHELGSMSGKPVYIVYPEEKMGEWALVRSVRDASALFTSAIDPSDYGDRELYGETWLAYLRPPEMEALNNETD